VPEQQFNLLKKICNLLVFPQIHSRFFVACHRGRKRTRVNKPFGSSPLFDGNEMSAPRRNVTLRYLFSRSGSWRQRFQILSSVARKRGVRGLPRTVRVSTGIWSVT